LSEGGALEVDHVVDDVVDEHVVEDVVGGDEVDDSEDVVDEVQVGGQAAT
jgi:hypothetical protein